MMPGVEPAGLQVEPQTCCDFFHERPLSLYWKFPCENVIARSRLAIPNRCDRDGNELWLELREQLRDEIGRHSRLIDIEQCVVSLGLVSDGIAFLACKREHLVEQRSERLKSSFVFASDHVCEAIDVTERIPSTSWRGILRSRSKLRRISRTFTACGLSGSPMIGDPSMISSSSP
jgi:hypothetical protein